MGKTAGKAIGYARVSTEEQSREGVSLAAQEAAVRAYCAMRGLELVEVVIDAGVTASKALSTREGGRRVLEAAKTHAIDAVVALKLDRVFRNARDCLEVTETWQKRDVALHLVDMGGQAVDTSSALGKFFLHLLAGVAEMERNLIAERTSSALRFKRSKSEKTGGEMPFGYVVDDDGKTLIKDASEQAVVRRIRRLRADGHSVRAIVDRLNKSRTPTRGKRWHPTTVVRLLGETREARQRTKTGGR